MRLGKRFLLVASTALGFLFFIHIFRISYQGPPRAGRHGVKLVEKNTNPDVCFFDRNCSAPKILFRIQSEHSNMLPVACLNDISIFREGIQMGLNFATLHGKSGDIIETKSFDLSESKNVVDWLSSLPTAVIIVGVSSGDIADKVSPSIWSALSLYGATKIFNWVPGNSYAIVGQRGLKKAAYEQVTSFFSKTEVLLQGCFDLPLGDLNSENINKVKLERLYKVASKNSSNLSQLQSNVTLGEKSANCGVSRICGEDEISLFLFSGEHKDDVPKMCVGGRMLFDRGLNEAGRGLNIMAFDPKARIVRAAAHFDTYEDGSTALEEFLDTIPAGDVVAAVSFDEASNMLSDMARSIFYEMGSSMIHRLKFRASWYFVGQKGISAYTPFEDLNVPSGNSWAKPVKASFCLPLKLSQWTGLKQRASLEKAKNVPKRHFCAKHDHVSFCADDKIDDPVFPADLLQRKNGDHPMFNIPILVIAGLSTSSLLATLESLVNQESLNLDMVVIAHDKEYLENSHVASLFHVKSLSFNASLGYNDLLFSSLDEVFTLFPTSPAVAVIEEDVILSSDWLSYLSQFVKNNQNRNIVDVINTFNPNGFSNTSTRASEAYRSTVTPFFSYLLTRTCYQEKIKSNKDCCLKRDEWHLNLTSITPELSRIRVLPPPNIEPVSYIVNTLFNRERAQSATASVINPVVYTEDMYDAYVKSLINSGTSVNFSSLSCENWKSSKFDSKCLAVIVDSVEKYDDVFNCFGLAFKESIISGFYKGIIRFSTQKVEDIIIILKNSVFYSTV